MFIHFMDIVDQSQLFLLIDSTIQGYKHNQLFIISGAYHFKNLEKELAEYGNFFISPIVICFLVYLGA